MGAPVSKFGQEIEEEEPSQGSLPSTPILTPKTRLVDLDPRSPSENIIRTPIEVLLAKNKNLLQVSNASTPLQITDKINSPNVKLKSIDPRSPTVDFTRTPIVVPEKDCQLPLKLHNKNLDNVRKTLIESPLTAQLKKKLPNRTPPKLLESNIILKPIETKRKSYVGILETNFDYIETDLDTGKPKTNSEENTEDEAKLEIITESRTVIHEYSTPPQVKHPSNLNYRHQEICLNDLSDPRSPSTQFIRTPIPLLQKLETLAINNDSCDKEICSKVQILSTSNKNDDNLKVTTQKHTNSPQVISNSISNIVDTKISQENQNKLEIIKDFDKKLTNLIYEDREKSATIIKNKKYASDKSRMPLSIRNSNLNLGKGALKLKVHDKPRKTAKDLSKIPIFQNKGNRGKFNQQCENTPPANLGDKVVERQQWDPDNTIII